MKAIRLFSTTMALTLATTLASAAPCPTWNNQTMSSDVLPLNLPPKDEQLAPPAGPRVADWGTFDLGLDFIYWKTQYTSTSFAGGGYPGSNPAIAFGGHLPKGKIDDLTWTFKPGLKARIGWIAPSNHWEVYAEYTWRYQDPTKAHAKPTGHNPNPRSQILTNPHTPSFAYGTLVTNFTHATGEWSQHFNVIDWMLSTNFYITKTLSLQPLAGLKTYEITSDFKNSYYGNSFFTADLAFDGSTYHVHTKEKAKGIGPRIGIKSLWNCNRQWGVFGNIAFSLPWSYFVESIYETITPPGGSASALTNIRWKEHQWQSVLEYQLGLSYQAWFSHEKYLLSLQIAWELQLWGSNRLLDVHGFSGTMGSMSAEGLTMNATFAF